MINKPIRNFLISLILFLIFFIGGSFIPAIYKLIEPEHDWVFQTGSILALIFALISVIGLIRNYLRDKKLTIFQILVFIGSFGILLYLTLIMLFFLTLRVWGFPIQD